MTRNLCPFFLVWSCKHCVLTTLNICLLQLLAPQKIIISLDYGRSSKQGQHLKHAGQTLPCIVQVKVQAVHSSFTWGTNSHQAQKAINETGQREEPAGLTQSVNQLPMNVQFLGWKTTHWTEIQKKIVSLAYFSCRSLLTCSRIWRSKFQLVA